MNNPLANNDVTIKKGLVLIATIKLNGKIIGQEELAVNEDILTYKNERGFNVGHTFSRPIEGAIKKAFKNYDEKNSSK